MAAQSEYFESLLYGSLREAQADEEIALKDVSVTTFQLLLQYMYTGCISIDGAQLEVCPCLQFTKPI